MYTAEQTTKFKMDRSAASRIDKALRKAYWTNQGDNFYKNSVTGIISRFNPASRTLTF